jgi:hypothetical protein
MLVILIAHNLNIYINISWKYFYTHHYLYLFINFKFKVKLGLIILIFFLDSDILSSFFIDFYRLNTLFLYTVFYYFYFRYFYYFKLSIWSEISLGILKAWLSHYWRNFKNYYINDCYIFIYYKLVFSSMFLRRFNCSIIKLPFLAIALYFIIIFILSSDGSSFY